MAKVVNVSFAPDVVPSVKLVCGHTVFVKHCSACYAAYSAGYAVSAKKETAHKGDCTRVWKRYDVTCPRCQELIAGAPARDGWQKEYYQRKAREDARQAQEIRDHFRSEKHLSGGCGPVCTFGEW